MQKHDWSTVLICISIVAVLCTAPIFAVTNTVPKDIDGTIEGLDEYGNIQLSLTKQDMERCGFRFSDELRFQCDDIEFVALYIDRFDGAISYQVCISTLYDTDKVSLLVFSSLSIQYIGLDAGDRFHLSYIRNGINDDLYPDIFDGVIMEREDWMTDEQFANFRCIRFNDNFSLCRSSGPFFNSNGSDRMNTTDSLFKIYGIQYGINMGDVEAVTNVAVEVARDLGNSPYCVSLYDDGKIVSRYAAVDNIIMADGLRPTFQEILSHSDERMDVFCHIGKDRTGFVFILLEALAGWDMQSIGAEYCETFVDLYGVDPDSEEYRNIFRDFYGRIVYLIGNPQLGYHVPYINWEEADYTKVDLNRSAETFLLDWVGLSRSEVDQLKALVS